MSFAAAGGAEHLDHLEQGRIADPSGTSSA
jgi:hypothetical protein